MGDNSVLLGRLYRSLHPRGMKYVSTFRNRGKEKAENETWYRSLWSLCNSAPLNRSDGESGDQVRLTWWAKCVEEGMLEF